MYLKVLYIAGYPGDKKDSTLWEAFGQRAVQTKDDKNDDNGCKAAQYNGGINFTPEIYSALQRWLKK